MLPRPSSSGCAMTSAISGTEMRDSSLRWLTLALFVLLSAGAAAEDNPFLSRGYIEACFVCHAADPAQFPPPRYPPPKIAGQHADYLSFALTAYRSGERNHSVMSSQAVEVPAEAIPDLANKVAKVSNAVLPQVPKNQADAKALRRGKILAERHCTVCHQIEGNAEGDFIPILNGQYPRYFASAVQDYRLGVRQSEVMTEAVRRLSPRQIEDIAAYYGSLTGLRPE